MDPEAQTNNNADANANASKPEGFCKQLGSSMYSCFFNTDHSTAATYVRFFNFVNATLLFMTGVLSLLSLSNTIHLVIYVLSAYLLFFGLLLCCFEMRFMWIERRVRDSFGFLYTYVGRTVFLLFIASLCFGIVESQSDAGITVGIFTVVNALFNMVIMYRHGKFFEDPSNEYSTVESAGSQYLRQNPQLVRQGVEAGVNYARENPEVARQGLEAGAQYARENPEDAKVLAQGAYQTSAYN